MISLGVVGSTQDEARRRLGVTPVLVTAERQQGGRGRRGSAWLHADRAVAASLAFRPTWPAAAWSRIPLVAGLSARDAAPRSLGLAWPNDLVVDGSKVGGLIAEADGEVVVVGLGLNLYWPRPVAGAAALGDIDPGPDAVHSIAGTWATALLDRLSRGPDRWGLPEYRSASVTVGCEVWWEPDGQGRAIDIAEDGGLIVEVDGRRVVLHAGAVRRVRSEGSRR